MKLRSHDISDKEASEAQCESIDCKEELGAARADPKPSALANMMDMFMQLMIANENERKEQRDRKQNAREERERRREEKEQRAKEEKDMLMKLLQQQEEASKLALKQQRETSEAQSTYWLVV